MKAWPALLLFCSLTACGARTGLDPFAVDVAQQETTGARYCADAGTPAVFVLTYQGVLFRFDPPSGAFDTIGTLNCPVASDNTPDSMAVDHEGTAYVFFNDGELFRVSTTDATCSPAGFTAPRNSLGSAHGMAFSSDPDGLGETLFFTSVAPVVNVLIDTLTALNTAGLAADPVGAFSPPLGSDSLAELTGTGDGRLFAFAPDDRGGQLVQLDKTNAAVLSDHLVGTPASPYAWAFSFWGGDFYFFTSVEMGFGPATSGSTVSRLHVTDDAVDVSYAALLGYDIVGAGVSTCAPR